MAKKSDITGKNAKAEEIALTEFSDSKYFEKIYNCYREATHKKAFKMS